VPPAPTGVAAAATAITRQMFREVGRYGVNEHTWRETLTSLDQTIAAHPDVDWPAVLRQIAYITAALTVAGVDSDSDGG
jgi:hypothetical protein